MNEDAIHREEPRLSAANTSRRKCTSTDAGMAQTAAATMAEMSLEFIAVSGAKRGQHTVPDESRTGADRLTCRSVAPKQWRATRNPWVKRLACNLAGLRATRARSSADSSTPRGSDRGEYFPE